MSIPVDVAAVPDAITCFGSHALLISNSIAGPPRVSSVIVTVHGHHLAMEAGHKTRANVTERPDVTLVWTAPDEPDYCLIVDGTARQGSLETFVVQPTSAVLHRLASTESRR